MMADFVGEDNYIPGLSDLPGNMGVYAQRLANNTGYGPHHIAGILGVLSQESGNREGDLEPSATNPSSGAKYIPQWLDRRPGFESWAQQNGLDKYDPTVQADYTSNELATTEGKADRLMRAANTPEEAARAWRQFERGGNYGNKDIASAQQIHDKFVKSASSQTAKQPAVNWEDVKKTAEDGKPYNPSSQLVRQQYDPATANWAEVARIAQGDDGNANVTNRYAVPPGQGALEGVGHFFAKLPQSFMRGFAVQAGMPVDLLNAGNDYYNQQPLAAHGVSDMAYFMPGMEDKGPATGSQTPQIPGGEQTIRKGLGTIGINTNLPAEEGDESNSANWASNIGMAMGSASPFMVGTGIAATKSAMAAGTSLVFSLVKQAAKDTSLNIFAGGMGKEMGEMVAGPPGQYQQERKNLGEAGGMAAGGAIGGAVVATVAAAKILFTAGLLASERAGNPGIRSLIDNHFGAAAIAQANADNPALAAENALKTGGIQGAGGALPEGFNTPAATASMDLPTQALMWHVVGKSSELDGNLRGLLQKNDEILSGMRPDAATEAGAGDITATLATTQRQRVNAKQQLIDNAVEESNRDFEAATRGAETNGEQARGLSREYLGNLKNRLMEAWSIASDATKAEWAHARSVGLGDATIPTQRLYDKLADMMSEAVRTGHQDNFPTKSIAQLYDRPPLKLFDSSGAPVQNHTQAYTLGNVEPWERVQGLYDNIDQELFSTMRQGGDPIKQQYLMRMQDEVLAAMRDMRQGGKFMSGQVPAALENAIRSTQENRRLFVESPVGQVLSFNNYGIPMANPGQSIRQWLGNSPETVGKVQAMFDAVAGKSLGFGQHPADLLHQDMSAWLRQEFADNFRNGGAKAADKFLNSNDAVLSHPTFQPLKDEFQRSVNSGSVAEQMQKQIPKEIDEIRNNRAQLYLDGDADKALDIGIRSKNSQTIDELIAQVKQDPTGRAMEGLGNMTFERLMTEGAKPNPGGLPGQMFSGAKSAEFLKNNMATFKAIDRELPGYLDRVKQFVSGTQMQERIQSKPTTTLSKDEINFSVTGIARLVGKLLGADFGRKLGTGTIQVPGMFSRLGGDVAERLFGGMQTQQAAKIMSNAMVDPKLFQELMQPITKESLPHLAITLEPFMLAAPAVVKGTYEQYNNPQPMP